MNKGCVSLMMWAYVCSVVFAGAAVGEAFAATKSAKEPAPGIFTTKPAKPQSEQGQPLANPRAKKSESPVVSTHQPEVVQKAAQPAPTELRPSGARVPRRMKVHKKVMPKAVVQPSKDLIYQGLLEDPQRYDPRPNYRTAGVLNPQTPDLAHDHFQELDRNLDGKVDPFERTLRRLDMERDLSTYQRQ